MSFYLYNHWRPHVTMRTSRKQCLSPWITVTLHVFQVFQIQFFFFQNWAFVSEFDSPNIFKTSCIQRVSALEAAREPLHWSAHKQFQAQHVPVIRNFKKRDRPCIAFGFSWKHGSRHRAETHPHFIQISSFTCVTYFDVLKSLQVSQFSHRPQPW